MNWDEYYVKLAQLVAEKSKDPSTKVGCVIVGPDNEIRSTGFNGFPRGVYEAIPERWDRPAKYKWVEHAERNALYNAARTGVALGGCRAYLNWEPTPCIDCTRGFIQVGIIEVIGPDIAFTNNKDWKFEISGEMLEEVGLPQRWIPWTK